MNEDGPKCPDCGEEIDYTECNYAYNASLINWEKALVRCNSCLSLWEVSSVKEFILTPP